VGAPEIPETPAAPQSSPEPASRVGWRRFALDTRALGRRVVSPEKGDFTRLAVVGAGVLALYGLREEIRDRVVEPDPDKRSPAAQDVRTLMASGLSTPLAALAFAGAGRFDGDSERTETAQVLLESTLWSVGLAAAGSFVIASERPRDGDEVNFFRTDGHGVSLDVALAASLAAPIDRRHLRPRPGDTRGERFAKGFGRAALYAGVAAVAWQRMESDAHWAPDVFLGAAAGFGVGYVLCDAHEDTRKPLPAPRVAFSPGGVTLRWRF